ncbi:hypothetical protein, partial [Klebsiella quasipneumoniae]|uniref:hypothetical protein n=1 Tax=Klebsiella quasipneumoniae TaxID=1463165 RepID=UPI0027321E2A
MRKLTGEALMPQLPTITVVTPWLSLGLGGDLQRLLLMDTVEDWRHRPEPDQLFYFSGGPGDFE